MPETAPRPKLFIGSSKEAIPYAVEVHAQLARAAQVTPWFGGTFNNPNEYTMEALERQLNQSDFGIFIFAPDDVARIRNQYVFVTRDNTVFEAGLFWGRLGRPRVFCIVPDRVKSRDDLVKDQIIEKYHLLSDLQGLSILTYDADHENRAAAVTVACNRIAERIMHAGTFPSPEVRLLQRELELEQFTLAMNRKQSILGFFSEYNRLAVLTDSAQKYHALAEAVRNSFLTTHNFRVIGAAIWQKQRSNCLAQVGGNVEGGVRHDFGSYDEREKPAVLEAFLTTEWKVFRVGKVAPRYVMCYPLGREYVVQVNITGPVDLNSEELTHMVEVENEELLETIRDLVGGDSR